MDSSLPHTRLQQNVNSHSDDAAFFRVARATLKRKINAWCSLSVKMSDTFSDHIPTPVPGLVSESLLTCSGAPSSPRSLLRYHSRTSKYTQSCVRVCLFVILSPDAQHSMLHSAVFAHNNTRLGPPMLALCVWVYFF